MSNQTDPVNDPAEPAPAAAPSQAETDQPDQVEPAATVDSGPVGDAEQAVDSAVGDSEDGEDGEDSGDAEVIAALNKLSERLFERMCRGVPVRVLMTELQKVDRAVYFRYFKGHRPSKIDARRLSKVLRKELFEHSNGLLAQLVVYNWDEHQWRLFGSLQKHIKAINEDVEAIEAITDEQADPIFDDLESRADTRGRQAFDRRDVAIACVINGVRVSDEYVQARWGDLFA